MGLRAELEIDVGAAGGQLSADIQGPTSALSSIALPVDLAQLESISGGVDLDSGGIERSVAAVANQARELLGDLPVASDLVQPIEAALVLLEQTAEGDGLASRMSELLETLGESFENQDDGFLSVLVQASTIVRDAPESSLLLGLARAFAGAGSSQVLPTHIPAQELLESADGALRLLGGLMQLETVLEESERLTGAMAASLDPATIAASVTRIQASLGSGESQLAAFVDAVDVNDAATLAVAVEQVVSVQTQLGELSADIAGAMGMAEATMAYLDVDTVRTEVADAAGVLRGATLGPLRGHVETLVTKVRPFTEFDLTGIGASTLDATFDTVEARVGEVAGRLSALDVAGLVAPVTDGVQFVADLFARIETLMNEVTAAVRAALARVQEVVASLPIETIAETIRTFLEPITAVIDAVRDLIEDVQAALTTAVNTADGALKEVEAALDAFKSAIDGVFAGAQEVVERFAIDQVVGAVSDQVQAFADVIAKAQMKPYFDTTIDVIDTTTGVVEAVPFGLLPADMKSEVDAAVAPVRQVDVDEVKTTIESILQIEDGEFALRDDVEAAIAELQVKYDELLDFVRAQDPRAALATVDAELEVLAARIQEIDPALTLAPVQEVVDQVKAAVASVDLDALLQPVRDVFDEIIAAIDQYSPAALVVPLEERIDEVRTRMIEETGLETWVPTLESFRDEATGLVDLIDPARLEPALEGALTELEQVLELAPDASAGGMGRIIAQLLSGLGLRIEASSFDRVVEWLLGGDADAALAERTGAIEAAMQTSLGAARRVDPGAISVTLTPATTTLREAAGRLADRLAAEAPERARLEVSLPGLEAGAVLGPLVANRARYLATLEDNAGLGEALRRTGLSEAAVAVGELQGVLGPLAPLRAKMNELLALLGLAPGTSLAEAMRTVLAAAPPQRIAVMLSPLVVAFRGRLEATIDGVLDPVKDGITSLEAIIAAIDLTPLREAIEAIVDEVKAQILALHPDELLGDVLASLEALKQTLVDDDPIAAVTELLTGLRELIAAVLAKANLEQLLEAPLAIYDHILGELEKLELAGLLDPIFDQLDAIAGQVEEGLQGTCSSFTQLQAALPSGGGGSSASGSISIG